jgi:glutathione S-transferase
MTSANLVVHGVPLSGHTHRVLSFLSILGMPYQLVESPAPVRATAAFRALNPLGQIPVLQDGELTLADSNAILVYLARRYAPGSGWLPDEPVAAAQVQRWLSIAAGEMKHGPAAARVLTLWGGPGELAAAQAIAERLLVFMDSHVAGRRFLIGEQATLADISGYPYIARAPEGRISLEPYPHVRAWLARVEALPGALAMPVTAIPELRT